MQLRTVLDSWGPSAKLKQLSSIVVYLKKDITPHDCLNIFTGFQMQQFRNTNIDITKTKFWEWMFVAWCNRSEYKMKYILNYWATKLQQPHRKIEKILVASGMGVGTYFQNGMQRLHF